MKILRKNGEVIYMDDCATIRETLEAATCKGVSLAYADLRNSYLEGVDLRGAQLPYADFNGSHMKYAKLELAFLQHANFYGACLFGAALCGAVCDNTNFRFCDMRGVNFDQADLKYAMLDGAVMDKRIVSVSGCGNSRRLTLYDCDSDIVWCGCFKGTLAEFEAAVDKKYSCGFGNQSYRAAIAFFKECQHVKS